MVRRCNKSTRIRRWRAFVRCDRVAKLLRDINEAGLWDTAEWLCDFLVRWACHMEPLGA
jgi:hypothetical protein